MNISTNLVIDGTDPRSGDFVSGLRVGPYVVFDIDNQMVVSPAFTFWNDAVAFKDALFARSGPTFNDALTVLRQEDDDLTDAIKMADDNMAFLRNAEGAAKHYADSLLALKDDLTSKRCAVRVLIEKLKDRADR